MNSVRTIMKISVGLIAIGASLQQPRHLTRERGSDGRVTMPMWQRTSASRRWPAAWPLPLCA